MINTLSKIRKIKNKYHKKGFNTRTVTEINYGGCLVENRINFLNDYCIIQYGIDYRYIGTAYACSKMIVLDVINGEWVVKKSPYDNNSNKNSPLLVNVHEIHPSKKRHMVIKTSKKQWNDDGTYYRYHIIDLYVYLNDILKENKISPQWNLV